MEGKEALSPVPVVQMFGGLIQQQDVLCCFSDHCIRKDNSFSWIFIISMNSKELVLTLKLTNLC